MSPNAIAASREALEQNSIELLLEISRILNTNNNTSDVLNPILMILADRYSLEDALITIFDNKSKEIYIDSSYGLSSNQQTRGRYQLGEGVIGEVVQTGNQKIVPKISSEPKFLHRAKERNTRKELSFICLPIKDQNKVTGTLSITMPYNKENDLFYFADFLKIISLLIVHPVILRRKLSIAQKQIEEEKNKQKDFLFSPEVFIGNSRNTKPIKNKIYIFAKSDVPVFISGEHGTGKSYTANIIHNNGVRKNSSLIQCNCTSVSEEDYMRIMFGVKISKHFGVTIDAYDTNTQALILQANNSTLLIEDIDLLPLHTQNYLLQIIQSEQVIIDNSLTQLSLRYIFTSELSLQQLKDEGKLIEGLYAILEPNTLTIPPLRERRDDIILIADMMLQQIVRSLGTKKADVPKRFSTPAIDLISHYHWPGNLNELYKVIEGAAYKSSGGVIHAHLLPPSLQSADSTNTKSTIGLIPAVERLEKDLIIDALKSTNGHLARSAELLKISDRIFGLRIKKYNINPKLYR